MVDTKDYIQRLFAARSITVATKRNQMFEEFVANDRSVSNVEIILKNQENIMADWKRKNRIMDIMESNSQIPNGTVGVQYSHHIDLQKMGWTDFQFFNLEGLEEHGLQFNKDDQMIAGTPNASGDFMVKLLFRLDVEEVDSVLNEKTIKWLVNPDPKSLWKDLPSSTDGLFPKSDNVEEFKKLGTKHIVVSSRRGRSHANVGSFRDDDYAFKYYEDTGWSVIAVSDGAGSSKFSRKGSYLACNEVVEYFGSNLTTPVAENFDEMIRQYITEENIKHSSSTDVSLEDTTSDETTSLINNGIENPTKIENAKSQINNFIYNYLGGCAKSAYNVLADFADRNQLDIRDLHSTLIFTLFKQYEFGYVVLSFSVGDCPIGLLNRDLTDVKLMNWLDVGEFSGGTRFITMPEIFTSDKFATRFGFKVIDDFSYLFLMTDGIYDAKFIVEANLEKLEKWKEFISDLEGNNDDNQRVIFNPENNNITEELAKWMDFWSAGNHDDRTLAVVF